MYLKELAVENKDYAIFVQVDDKNKVINCLFFQSSVLYLTLRYQIHQSILQVPIGEPDRQALATERSRPTLHPIDGVGHMTLFAGSDHDAGSNRDNAVPTVTLISDILEESLDSFYQGQVYVAVKSSVRQPSTVVRAHIELSKHLIREKKDEQYIGILLTDGGPEHNLNFTLVQIALIIMWRMVTFDILVVCRS